MSFLLLLLFIPLFSCHQMDIASGIPDEQEERILSNENLKDIIQILKTENFEVYNQKQDIPKAVKGLLTKWYGEQLRFASNGKRYRKTCMGTNPKMPSREIIMILKSKKYFVLTYNHGGRGFHQHILFSELQRGKIAKTIWIGNASRELKTKKDIIQELEGESKWMHTNMVCY